MSFYFFKSFFFLSILLIYYICSVLTACQKRVPDLVTDGCEPPCGCWEMNSGSLEEQPVLLTSETSLQPPKESLQLLSLGAFDYSPQTHILVYVLVISMNKMGTSSSYG